MGYLNIGTTQVRRCLKNFHLGLLVNLLDVLLSNTVESERFFGTAPHIRSTTDVVIGSEKVQCVIKCLKNCAIVDLLQFNVGFLGFTELDVCFFVVGLEELLKNTLVYHIFQTINDLFVILCVESGLFPVLQLGLCIF